MTGHVDCDQQEYNVTSVGSCSCEFSLEEDRRRREKGGSFVHMHVCSPYSLSTVGTGKVHS